MLNPFDEHNITELSAKEFEITVKDFLEASDNDLKDFIAEHRSNVSGVDGSYEVDIKATFIALGVKFQVLVECKHHKNPIKREVVQILHDRIRSTGSHKGMIFATSTFQKGALDYAKTHGIALIRIAEGKTCYETRSLNHVSEPPPWLDIPKFVGWWMVLSANGSITRTSISPDRPTPLIDFLDIK